MMDTIQTEAKTQVFNPKEINQLFDIFPDEVWQIILSHVDLQSKYKLATVSLFLHFNSMISSSLVIQIKF